jgi:hypothetical protein
LPLGVAISTIRTFGICVQERQNNTSKAKNQYLIRLIFYVVAQSGKIRPLFIKNGKPCHSIQFNKIPTFTL